MLTGKAKPPTSTTLLWDSIGPFLNGGLVTHKMGHAIAIAIAIAMAIGNSNSMNINIHV